MPITVYDLAKHLGAKEDGRGAMSGAEFARVGLPILGGCEVCGSTVSAANAYPSRTGFLRCEACIGDNGYDTPEEADAEITKQTIMGQNFSLDISTHYSCLADRRTALYEALKPYARDGIFKTTFSANLKAEEAQDMHDHLAAAGLDDAFGTSFTVHAGTPNVIADPKLTWVELSQPVPVPVICTGTPVAPCLIAEGLTEPIRTARLAFALATSSTDARRPAAASGT